MKKFISTLLVSLLVFTTTVTGITVKAVDDNKGQNCTYSKAKKDLKRTQKKLWDQHVVWTRNFIISDLASLEDKDAVLQRLLKNQEDIGTSIKPYYGEEAGNKLTELLKEHIVVAGKIVDAAKVSNKQDLEKYSKLWYENVDKIADFLSAANPNWPKQTVKDMLYKHLQYTTDEVVSRIAKDWKADIEAYDKGQEHMMMFANMISDGIIKQFPDKFK